MNSAGAREGAEARVKTITGADGSGYLTKVYLGHHLRLHIFWRGDSEPDCHDHPSNFWTFPLVGYWEQLASGECRRVKPFRLHFRRAEFAHRVLHSDETASPLGSPFRPVVTLIWWGKPRREWGFHTAPGWMAWWQYLGLAAPQLQTAGLTSGKIKPNSGGNHD